MFIICVASSFSWVIIRENYPRLIGDFLASLNLGQTNMLLLFVLIYLILGCFLESIAIMMLTIPIFFPVIVKAGIHPVHFGIIMLVDLMIGLLTPPVGICLYAVSSVANTPIEKVVKELIPFFIALTICLLLLVYLPQISLWLPNLARGR
jgi:TRAP-type C4-dicarboxylate transport system permease large subunit